jgi:non-specific serine/threonine protein kinase/serine/threonine-protein kinase
MQTENWKKVKELLNEVLPLTQSERQKFFGNSQINDEMRREVESLLAFEEESEDLMQLSMVEYLKDFIASDELGEHALVGQEIGVYKIVRELGYGGMGAVYQAERTDGKFDQTVALKLLKREMNTAALRRRFGQEREILASLEHPNIARLLDAGTTDDKTPYLAMEYVEGLPIDEYCRKQASDLNQRLDLFRKVCQAVDFAHRNLIVHRDLKPSNILITKDGTPKLLDFGISKILSAELEQLNTATITKLGVMTPSYASPEQLQNKSVTTATDIYSLGVILYELLSGHRPFETKEADLKEIYQAVIELEPPLPSVGIADLGLRFADSEIETIRLTENTKGQNKQTNPQTAIPNPQLKGDLDNIILKALRKEPERRYSSAENFAEDIRRHQVGLPVTARPNTFAYRAEKFVSRNKVSVIAAILILLAIVGGIITTLWQAQVAQTERAKAERRFNDVRKLANSFLFNLTPKIEKLPGSTPAKEELVSLALEYLDSLSNEAGDDLELQRELAAAYEKVGDVQGNQLVANLGDTEGAAKSYEKALTIRQRLYELQPNNLTAMSDLASSYGKYAEIQRQVGTSDQVKEYIQKYLDLREEIARRNPNDFETRKNLAIAVRAKGLVLYTEAKYKEAVENYNRANQIYEKLLQEQPDNSEVAENLAYMFIDIGEAQGWDGDLEAAEISLKKGVDLLAPLAEKYPNNQNLQRSLMNAFLKKGDSTIETKDYEKAVNEYSKAVGIAENSARVDPQNIRAKWDIVNAKKNLADAVNLAGRSKESLEILKSALELAEQLTAKDSDNSKNYYEIATVRFKMGETFYSMKDYESALKTYEQSNKELRDVVDMDPKYRFAVRTIHLSTMSIGETYAALAEKQNDKELYKKSLENYQNALNGFRKMKDERKLGDYDNTLFPEIETAINKVENKIGK